MAKAPIETRLMNKAVDYLGRYASSQQRLSEVLGRFATRKLDQHDPDEIAAAIAATVTRCQALGYVDDDAFAQSQARSHRRQGRSQLPFVNDYASTGWMMRSLIQRWMLPIRRAQMASFWRPADLPSVDVLARLIAGALTRMTATPSCSGNSVSLAPWHVPDFLWQSAAR